LVKSLRTLQLARRLGRAERLEAGRAEIVDDAGRDRASGPTTTNRPACLAEIDHRRMVRDSRAERIRLPARYRHCPARTTSLVSQWGRRQIFHGQSVFAATGSRAGGCSLSAANMEVAGYRATV
jgi:hypothetical protein